MHLDPLLKKFLNFSSILGSFLNSFLPLIPHFVHLHHFGFSSKVNFRMFFHSSDNTSCKVTLIKFLEMEDVHKYPWDFGRHIWLNIQISRSCSAKAPRFFEIDDYTAAPIMTFLVFLSRPFFLFPKPIFMFASAYKIPRIILTNVIFI